MTRARSDVLARLPTPRRETVLYGLLLVNVQALFVVTHAAVTGRSLLHPFPWYPLVWMDVGLWAIVRTDPPSAPARARHLAAVVAGAYFLLLSVASNTIGPGEYLGGNPAIGTSLRLFSVPPGWAPSLLHNGPYLHLSLTPPYVIGFLALAYLVYATVLEARSVASLGLVALFSCVSCTLPIFAALAAAFLGIPITSLLTGTGSYLLPVGTAVYVLTVAVLYWRPFVPGTAGSTS